MQFRTRSKEQAIADIASKVSHLPPNHPERPALLRMIKGLRSELQMKKTKKNQMNRTSQGANCLETNNEPTRSD
jgi:hypothetical protein